ncbi:AraC family transcriptional regulator [Flavisphingomonas formosensis]|uniref:AraC family transcriptional regulator n=1 Tax=Flavisphingomonas formosensis TaxID=861534 RepID=UPI0012FBEC80|nr:AraC family transcriptional regulator [Sphingomonas formosensis]
MPKHIAQVAPRRASRALLQTVLQQVRTIDVGEGESIACRCFGKTLDEVIDPHWVGPMPDDAFTDAFSAGMTLIVGRCAWREGRPPMTREEYGLLCHCVITCRTLRDVIERAASFMRALASRPGRLTIEVIDDVAEFCIHTDYGVRDRIGLLTDLAGLAAFHRLFAWLIDAPVELLSVRMCYPSLIGSRASEFMIAHPIIFQAETNAFRFAASLLDRPVVRSPQQLIPLLRRFPFDVNDTQIARDTLANRVRSLMAANLSQPKRIPTEREMAELLGISLSTLKRRLQMEQASYRSIRDALLCAVAIESLESERESVAALAARLGFADTGSFRHAFKRWTGRSPGRHRRAAL